MLAALPASESFSLLSSWIRFIDSRLLLYTINRYNSSIPWKLQTSTQYLVLRAYRQNIFTRLLLHANYSLNLHPGGVQLSTYSIHISHQYFHCCSMRARFANTRPASQPIGSHHVFTPSKSKVIGSSTPYFLTPILVYAKVALWSRSFIHSDIHLQWATSHLIPSCAKCIDPPLQYALSRYFNSLVIYELFMN